MSSIAGPLAGRPLHEPGGFVTGTRSEGVKVDRERRTRRVPQGEDYLDTGSGGGPAARPAPPLKSPP